APVVKILLWQSSHLYMPRWKEWLKSTLPAFGRAKTTFFVLLWHLSQLPVTLKAMPESWQAPQERSFSIAPMVYLRLPFPPVKIPLWQSTHMYIFLTGSVCILWLKTAGTTLKTTSGLPLWHLLQSPFTEKASFPL